MARLIAVIILFAVAISCASADEEPSFAFFDHDYKRTPLGDVIDKASMKLLKATYTEAIDKNVIASPLGVLILLSLYSTGAEGPIRDEIVAALGAEDYDQLLSSYTRLSSQFSAMDSSYLTLANKVYVAEQYQLAEDFTATAERSFHSGVERIDFTQPKEAASVINRWADEKTKGHIKNAVTEDALDPDIAAGLFNVIFFQGHWNVPFNASETLEKDFHVNKSTTVQKPMMRLKRSLFYHEDKELGARMVELPYKEHNFRMVVVLPDEVDGLPALLENVAAKGLLSDVFALRPSGCDVILEMPKFEINSDLDLNKLLPKVGVSKIFSEPATGVLKAESVKVSKAFQKAFVKVDEEGATAGAFTGFLIVTKSGKSVPPPPLEFKVDRPFLFTILHEDITLFTGMVIVPMSLDSTPPPPMEFKADHPFLFVILHDDIVFFSGTYTH